MQSLQDYVYDDDEEEDEDADHADHEIEKEEDEERDDAPPPPPRAALSYYYQGVQGAACMLQLALVETAVTLAAGVVTLVWAAPAVAWLIACELYAQLKEGGGAPGRPHPR